MNSQNLSLLLLICLILLSSSLLLNNNQIETFGCNCNLPTCNICGTSQTAPAGAPKCGLRGNILRTRPIDDCACSPQNQYGFRDCYNSNPYQFPQIL